MRSKKIIACSIALLFLVACVPTPSEEVVVGKAEGRLENLIAESHPVEVYAVESAPQDSAAPVPTEAGTVPNEPAPTVSDADGELPAENTLRAALGAPGHTADAVSGKVYGGTLNVNIDAEVEVPNVAAVPVYTVRVKTFTPEERERITKRLLGEGPYYKFNPDLSRKVAEKRAIEETTQKIADCDNRIYGENYDYESARWMHEQNLQQYLKSYAELPEPGPMEPWAGSFDSEKTAIADAENRYLAFSDGSMWLHDQAFSSPHSFGGHPAETPEQQAAMDIAEKTLNEVMGETFTAATITYDKDLFMKNLGLSAQDFPPSEYSVGLLRTAAGIPCYPYSAYHGSDTALEAAGVSQDYDDPVLPEQVEVLVRDGEMVALNWYNAIEFVRTENENVALLPFEQILDIFKKQIFRSIYLDKAENGEWTETMVIERICLSYMKVRKKDAPTERYLLPVWDFMGYTYNEALDDASQMLGHKVWFSGQSLLTINAIDGSIIDREAGY